MPSNPISKYAQIGLICGGASTAVQAAIHEQQVSMVLLAALVGSLTGLVVGALYGYLKLRSGPR
jgi:ABC-type uncharacterized transport system permease subunit